MRNQGGQNRQGLTLLADMQVIVRLQDRGTLRLDRLHDQALCEPEGCDDLSITHIMPGAVRDFLHIYAVVSILIRSLIGQLTTPERILTMSPIIEKDDGSAFPFSR
jgi:hypothetical protein